MSLLPSLCIVIPAYNEEKRLPKTLDRILSWIRERGVADWELIVVNDGSRDGTAKLVQLRAQKDPSIRLLENPGNRGKGYSVRHGMLNASKQWALLSDADLSSPIEECEKLYAAAIENGAVAAIGSRALNRALVGVHQGLIREASGRTFNLVVRAITGLPFRDTQCGFKLYRQDAAQAIFSRQRLEGFSFDVEDLFIAKQLGLKTIEVAVRWDNVEGTKVSALAGIQSFTDLLHIRSNWARGQYR